MGFPSRNALHRRRYSTSVAACDEGSVQSSGSHRLLCLLSGLRVRHKSLRTARDHCSQVSLRAFLVLAWREKKEMMRTKWRRFRAIPGRIRTAVAIDLGLREDLA